MIEVEHNGTKVMLTGSQHEQYKRMKVELLKKEIELLDYLQDSICRNESK